MQNVLASWSTLDLRRRIVVIGAGAAVFVAILLLSRLASSKDLDLLYGGLEPGVAGGVISALEQNGAVYQVRGNAIYVESGMRDELRMVLAGQGLPASGSAGYELLDNLSGFGTTSQMFDATYWRAKEGELARTIVASPQIKTARVHISNTHSQGFQRGKAPTASVFVTPSGMELSESQGKALRFLVASAVSGLEPEHVSVINGETGIILGSESSVPTARASRREESLKQNVQRLLEARVGPGNAIVELSLDIVSESESIVERRFDPEGRVVISTDTEERSSTASGTSGGAVTVASNLPDGDARSDGRKNNSQDSETRERVNFEVSETKRELVRVPGDIRRLSVAVLVNGTPIVDETGTETIAPRSDEELETLRALISAAVGFNEERGDQITIRSLAFEPVAELGTSAGEQMGSGLDATRLAQVGALALVAVVLGLFVIRPILSKHDLPSRLELSAPSAEKNDKADAESAPALTGEIAEDDREPQLPIVGNLVPRDSGRPARLRNASSEIVDPVERLRQIIRERQDETVEVLRSWMDDSEEKV